MLFRIPGKPCIEWTIASPSPTLYLSLMPKNGAIHNPVDRVRKSGFFRGREVSEAENILVIFTAGTVPIRFPLTSSVFRHSYNIDRGQNGASLVWFLGQIWAFAQWFSLKGRVRRTISRPRENAILPLCTRLFGPQSVPIRSMVKVSQYVAQWERQGFHHCRLTLSRRGVGFLFQSSSGNKESSHVSGS